MRPWLRAPLPSPASPTRLPGSNFKSSTVPFDAEDGEEDGADVEEGDDKGDVRGVDDLGPLGEALGPQRRRRAEQRHVAFRCAHLKLTTCLHLIG